MCVPHLKYCYSSKYSSGHLSANCEAIVKNKMEIQTSKKEKNEERFVTHCHLHFSFGLVNLRPVAWQALKSLP